MARSRLKHLIGRGACLLLALVSLAQADPPAPDPVHGPAAAAGAMPQVRTVEEKLGLLLWIRENVPQLFEDAAKYDIGLFELLEDQRKLYEQLASDPEYLKALSQRSPYLDISYRPKTVATSKELRIKAEAVARWREELAHVLRSLPVFTDTAAGESVILGAMRATVGRLGNRSSQGLVTGLILSLPPEERTQVFALGSMAERIEHLRRALPDPLPPSFKAEAQGFKAGVGREEVFAALKAIQAEESRLGRLAELHMVLQDRETHAIQGSRAELESRLEGLTAADLTFFADKDARKPRLDRLEARFRAAGNDQVRIKGPQVALAFAEVSSHVEGLSSQTEKVTVSFKRGIILKEVPPIVGIFRGCTGGDCATQYSFPYPNAPNERVYFVHGDDGRLKGYVSAQIVEVNGKKTLNLITIAGPRISAADTELIFSALDQARAKIGVEQLSLPDPGRHAGLINFQPVLGVYADYTRDRPKAMVTYPDAPHRKKIQEFSSGHNTGAYDRMEENPQVVVIQPRVLAKDAVEFDALEKAPPSPEVRKVSRSDVIDFGLDLHYSARARDLREVLTLGKVSPKEFEALTALLPNPGGLTVPAYEAELGRRIQGLGGDEGLLGRKSYLTLQGRLKAPDSLSEAHAQGTVSLVVDYLKNGDLDPSEDAWILEFMAKHSKALAGTREFSSFLSGLLQSEDDEDAAKVTQILRAGIHPGDPAELAIATRRVISQASQQVPKDETILLLKGLLEDPRVTDEARLPHLLEMLRSRNEVLSELVVDRFHDASGKLKPEILAELDPPVIEYLLTRLTEGGFGVSDYAYEEGLKRFKRLLAGRSRAAQVELSRQFLDRLSLVPEARMLRHSFDLRAVKEQQSESLERAFGTLAKTWKPEDYLALFECAEPKARLIALGIISKRVPAQQWPERFWVGLSEASGRADGGVYREAALELLEKNRSKIPKKARPAVLANLDLAVIARIVENRLGYRDGAEAVRKDFESLVSGADRARAERNIRSLVESSLPVEYRSGMGGIRDRLIRLLEWHDPKGAQQRFLGFLSASNRPPIRNLGLAYFRAQTNPPREFWELLPGVIPGADVDLLEELHEFLAEKGRQMPENLRPKLLPVFEEDVARKIFRLADDPHPGRGSGGMTRLRTLLAFADPVRVEKLLARRMAESLKVESDAPDSLRRLALRDLLTYLRKLHEGGGIRFSAESIDQMVRAMAAHPSQAAQEVAPELVLLAKDAKPETRALLEAAVQALPGLVDPATGGLRPGCVNEALQAELRKPQ